MQIPGKQNVLQNMGGCGVAGSALSACQRGSARVSAGQRGSARGSAGQRGSARVSAGQCVNQRHGCALPLPYLLCGDDGAVINGLRPGVFDGGGDAKRIEEEEMTI